MREFGTMKQTEEKKVFCRFVCNRGNFETCGKPATKRWIIVKHGCFMSVPMCAIHYETYGNAFTPEEEVER